MKKEKEPHSVSLGTAREAERVRVFPFLVAKEAELTIFSWTKPVKRCVLVWGSGKWVRYWLLPSQHREYNVHTTFI